MGLVLSIPIKSKASTQIRANEDFKYTYSDGYDYQFFIGNDIPNPFYFNSDVLDYVIQKSAEGKFFEINSILGTKINNISSRVFNRIFSLFYSAQVGLDKRIQDWITSSWGVYQWKFDCTGINPDYQGHQTYGTAYGFRFEGAFGEKIDLVLDSSGNFYGTNPIGNYTFNTDPEIIQWIGINQENPDPNDPSVYMPSGVYVSINDLKAPYFKGDRLYFTIYQDGIGVEYYIENCEECAFNWSIYGGTTSSTNNLLGLYMFDSKISELTWPRMIYRASDDVGIMSLSGDNNTWYIKRFNDTLPSSLMYTKVRNSTPVASNSLSFSFSTGTDITWKGNIPNNTILYENSAYLGYINGSPVSGIVPMLWLEKVSYTPTINPPAIPENPVPVETIPSDPDTPIPNTNPDPVPGITYPVNPTPPIITPLPSIVSGNDDLWPSVVELQNIEIDLSGYISSLGDYEFPDLSSITSSFAGAIVWVSTIMSALFNGSDFSILFAVLSSFFIVAALLGLYKWWNHK